MAFKGDAEGLRIYGAEIAKQQPNRSYAADLLDLASYLVECDFEGAEAKIETLKFKYQESDFRPQVRSTSNLIKIHIDFSYGRFEELEKRAREEIADFYESNSALEIIDILQIFRILAHKHLILNEYSHLNQVALEVDKVKTEGNDQEFYLKNSIQMMLKSANGEHRAAIELAKINLSIAKKNEYTGIFHPFDSQYIKSISLLSMASTNEALHEFEILRNSSKNFSHWPWYFLAHGNLVRNMAINSEFAKALSLIREERDLILSFNFRNSLSFLSDANELFVRYLMKDIDRIEILVNRLPDLILVRQIKALKDEWGGKDMLVWINDLPEATAREKIYKLTALADYYGDRETLSLKYMKQSLLLIEETGSIEFLLRQHKLFDIIAKAAAEINSPFMEEIIKRVSERVRVSAGLNSGGLPTPLTARELEVVRHLSTGKPISSISASLHVSMNTMKTHLRNIYRKLEVDNREKAVEKATELFLI